MAKGNQVAGKLLLLGFGSLFALLFVEAALRIHPPFELRVKGNAIVLPVNTEHVVRNDDGKSPKLDSRIVLRRNSLGFRGVEPPEPFEDHLTLVTVGGSTTECSFLTEGKTWSDRLGQQLESNFGRLWLNNAGLDGHSTFGHLALLRGYLLQLRPDVVIFLIGNNDRSRGSPNSSDLRLDRTGPDWTSLGGFVKSLAHYSDTVALTVSLLRYKRARDLGLIYRGQVDVEQLEHLSTPQEEAVRMKASHRETHVPPYRRRLVEMIEISRAEGIEPVFVTQPGLYGPAIDDVSGIDLGSIERNGVDGNLAWEILEMYNEATREVGEENDVLVVDLALSLEKSSLFFYDLVHYTNEGATEIGRILQQALCPFLAERFPAHRTKDCPASAPLPAS